jgi:hypothetical protein
MQPSASRRPPLALLVGALLLSIATHAALRLQVDSPYAFSAASCPP